MAQHPDYIDRWEKRTFPIYFKWTTGGFCTVHNHDQFDKIKRLIGITLHEIEAQEMPAPALPGEEPAAPAVVAPSVLALRVVPDAVTVAPDSVQAFECVATGPGGLPVDVSPTWTVHGPGAIDALGMLFTGPKPGTCVITAQAGGCVAVATVTVADLADPETVTVPGGAFTDTPAPPKRSHHKAKE